MESKNCISKKLLYLLLFSLLSLIIFFFILDSLNRQKIILKNRAAEVSNELDIPLTPPTPPPKTVAYKGERCHEVISITNTPEELMVRTNQCDPSDKTLFCKAESESNKDGFAHCEDISKLNIEFYVDWKYHLPLYGDYIITYGNDNENETRIGENIYVYTNGFPSDQRIEYSCDNGRTFSRIVDYKGYLGDLSDSCKILTKPDEHEILIKVNFFHSENEARNLLVNPYNSVVKKVKLINVRSTKADGIDSCGVFVQQIDKSLSSEIALAKGQSISVLRYHPDKPRDQKPEVLYLSCDEKGTFGAPGTDGKPIVSVSPAIITPFPTQKAIFKVEECKNLSKNNRLIDIKPIAPDLSWTTEEKAIEGCKGFPGYTVCNWPNPYTNKGFVYVCGKEWDR